MKLRELFHACKYDRKHGSVPFHLKAVAVNSPKHKPVTIMVRGQSSLCFTILLSARAEILIGFGGHRYHRPPIKSVADGTNGNRMWLDYH